MDSRLHSLYSPPHRHAEASDSRLAIHREDLPRHRRKRDEREPPQAADDLWRDVTAVSVAALLAFLSGLAAPGMAATETADAESRPEPPSGLPAPEEKHVSGRGLLAARAYARTAEALPSSGTKALPALPSSSSSSSGGTDPASMRVISRLIAGLKILEARGLTELVIRREGTFLESVERAVQDALSEGAARL